MDCFENFYNKSSNSAWIILFGTNKILFEKVKLTHQFFKTKSGCSGLNGLWSLSVQWRHVENHLLRELWIGQLVTTVTWNLHCQLTFTKQELKFSALSTS